MYKYFACVEQFKNSEGTIDKYKEKRLV